MTIRDGMLDVSQIFGPTIQGEGSAAGRHCLFLRLYGCNLTCAWCDTAYTWADTDLKAAKTQSGIKYDKNDPALGRKKMSYYDVMDAFDKIWNMNTPTIVVVSGGEPMMQQEGLLPVMRGLYRQGHQVHIETAGTITPMLEFDPYVTQYNVSPKLAHSGNVLTKRYRPLVLKEFVRTHKAWFKFVVSGIVNRDEQFDEIDRIVKDNSIPANRVMVMPEGTDRDDLTLSGRKIVDSALARGYGLSLRMHVDLWGNVVNK